MGKTRKDRRDKDFTRKEEGNGKRRKVKERNRGWSEYKNVSAEEVISDFEEVDELLDDLYDD